MSRILINGMSAKSAGGKSILRNLLGVLSRGEFDHRFLVAVPKGAGYEEFDGHCIHIRELSDTDSLIGLLRISYRELPHMLVQERCHLVLNLSDIPIPTKSPQVFLFDWSYAAFPESEAWRMGGWRDRIVRHGKLTLFKRNIHFISLLVAQSEFMANRISTIYGIKNTAVVNNAVSLENLAGGEDRDFELGSGFKLLCLSAYYSHKNLEILLPVAQKIKHAGINAKIVTTIDPKQHSRAAAFIRAVTEQKIEDVLLNVGAIPMAYVPSLFKQTDALILPTLLESFSGTYVEAMFHRRPILTSRLGFAQAVCREAALYFDPMDPDEIFRAIVDIQENPSIYQDLVETGRRLLGEMPDWPSAAASLVQLCERTLSESADKPTEINYN